MSERDDNKAYFSQALDEQMPSLYSVAMRLTRNNSDAEDLVAETATKAWCALDSLEDRARFRPWIFRILHNCYISDYRKKAVRPTEAVYDELAVASDDSEIAGLLVQQPDDFLNWWANPEQEVINQLLGKDLHSAIESLPEPFRVVVVLINIEGLSYDEAADALGTSPGTIRSRMNRGRTLLQKALWHHARDAGLLSQRNTQESTP